jgi:hypothetical protein
MPTEMVVALIAGVVAMVSAGLTLRGQVRTAQLESELEGLRLAEQRRFEAEQTTARYREPLARAAYDLQSRLYNILQPEKKFLHWYYEKGDERERSYAVDNTTFLIAQYFGWTEAIRRDIQYINLGQDEKTRQLARLQDNIYSLFQTDRFNRIFRVFAGEQRAIGERMLINGPRGLECLGYAAFLDHVVKGGDPLIEGLRADVPAASQQLEAVRGRLVALQHALIELLEFLDPKHVRFPEEHRTRVSETG